MIRNAPELGTVWAQTRWACDYGRRSCSAPSGWTCWPARAASAPDLGAAARCSDRLLLMRSPDARSPSARRLTLRPYLTQNSLLMNRLATASSAARGFSALWLFPRRTHRRPRWLRGTDKGSDIAYAP